MSNYLRIRAKNRARKYIPLPERLAATLAMLLPAEQRDRLRASRAKADTVIALFEFDHVVLHALDGSDEWFNLTPTQVREHRSKSRRDTSAVAKVDRIIARENEHREAVNRIIGRGTRITGAPTRVSRPFPGGRDSRWRRRMDGTVERRSE